MNAQLVLRLRRPFSLNLVGDNVSVGLWSTTLTFPALPPGMRRALDRLAHGAPAGELSQIVVDVDGPGALALWYFYLGTIEQRAGIIYELTSGDRVIARAIATTPEFRTGLGVAANVYRWVLSRFAFVHRSGSALMLESPVAGAQVELIDPAVLSLIGAVRAPVLVDDVLSSAPSMPSGDAKRFFDLLEYLGLLMRVARSGGDASEEDREISKATWQLPDLLLHRRSRAPWHEAMDTPAPQPPVVLEVAIKPGATAGSIELAVPDLADLSAHDASFTSVLEQRKSVRVYGQSPITKTQLGEFLYRAARISRVVPADSGRPYETTARPYPGAGACYELEVYVAVDRCEGLAAGLYRYDARDHRLEIVKADASLTPRLLEEASIGAGMSSATQVLIVLAARFGRLMPKYGTGSYALILKDVGVLLQTMYLVATAMRLAPCAVGSGDSELFSRVTGLGIYDETSVGELLLGSLPGTPV